jgi:hypothetical protein
VTAGRHAVSRAAGNLHNATAVERSVQINDRSESISRYLRNALHQKIDWRRIQRLG